MNNNPLFRTSTLLILLLMNSFFLFQSCEKEHLLTDPTTASLAPTTPTVNYANTYAGTRDESSEPVQTELGKLRQNPYTVAEMTKAYNLIHGTNETALPTTHTYVKFTPTTLEHIDRLEASDIILQDYPFEYEVIKEGDYYQQPVDGAFPEFYGVVEAGTSISEIPHQLIAPLHLDKSDPILLAQSYFQTGNQAEIFSEIFNNTGLYIEDIPTITLNRIPPIIDCDDGCRPVLVLDTSVPYIEPEPGSQAPFENYIWECDCTPPPPPPTPTLNNCGCPIPANTRIPAGCVQVFDTELSAAEDDPSTYLPVRRVKIIMSDRWFSFDETETDDNGCWSMPNERYSGRARMWVQFTNERGRIRGSRNTWKFWELFQTVEHYTGRFRGPFNHIETNFDRGPDGSKTRRLWGSATVNNALHEFHEYTIADGVLPPSDGMDIFIDHDVITGYAIMGTQNELSITAGGVAGGVGTVAAAAVLGINPFISIYSWAIVRAYLPDVMIGYDFNNSDRLKELSYHEFAHAIQYRQGGHDYWLDLVVAEINANGHGDQFSEDADFISLIESWAHHLGHSYADRTYLGMDVSNLNQSWLERLEEDINESPNHIPEGLYHDLIDNTNANEVMIGGIPLVVDNVSGFTNQQMFSCFTSEIRSIEAFRVCLVNNHLAGSGNTLMQLNDLFNSY